MPFSLNTMRVIQSDSLRLQDVLGFLGVPLLTIIAALCIKHT